MKIRLISIFLTTIFLISCKNKKEEEFKSQIYGDWNFVRVGSDNTYLNKEINSRERHIEIPYIYEKYNNRNGYIFYHNNSCEVKSGFFELVQVPELGRKRLISRGTDTRYKIEGDSLKIFNIVSRKWSSKKIRSISLDTLTLEVADTVFFKYAKSKYKIDNNLSFDRIIVSTSPCLGTCPVSTTSADQYGNFIFYGKDYTTKKGILITKISRDFYRRIERSFKKANIEKLKEYYSSNISDGSTTAVIFIKDSKIYKNIQIDRGNCPDELYWAYQQLSTLYQRLELKPILIDNQVPLSIFPEIFETKEEECYLDSFESLDFIENIRKGRIIKHDFIAKYTLICRDLQDNLYLIKTDGRYYKIGYNQSTITVDLGFDFLQRNNLFRKFITK